jgi:hypothetical protein
MLAKVKFLYIKAHGTCNYYHTYRVKSLTRPTASGFGVSQIPEPAGTALLSGKTKGTMVIKGT